MANGNTSFGYLLPTREVVMAPGNPDFASLIDLAETAEGHGFDSVWCGDSVLARPRLEALSTLAAIAGRTQRVKLGTAVFLPALRNPVILANEVANLDIISNGRVILGVGIASKSPAVEKEFNACGVSFRHRVSIFEECITLMRRLWTEPEVTFNGRHFQLDGVSLGLQPVQMGGVPIWMAASAEKPQRRMLKIGDGWFPNSTSPDAFTEGWQQIESLAKESGDDAGRLHKALYTTLNINEDKAQADKEMREFIEGYYNMPFETMSRTQSVFTGNVQDAIGWLKGFIDAGAQTIVIRFGGPNQAGQLELCGKEVIPQLRAA
jgi:alkanesulfonate monooxygenase SsuD/methylene tetrahydromethanopterin reductase-like flavin-dependent oxidoreductase (luciferase family)